MHLFSTAMSSGSRLAGGMRIGRLVGGVLSLQMLAQVLMFLSGLLLLRWLSVEQYAQYTVAFGFLATLSALVDMGVPVAVMPLIGDRAGDRKVFGGYLRAALHLRTRVVAVVLPISAIAFLWLTADHDWGVQVQAGLFAAVALGLLARAIVDIFSLPLLMNEAYRSYYSPQISTAIVRIASQGLLQLTRALTSVTASLVNAVTVLANGVLYRRAAAGRIELPERADPERIREIRRMVAPLLPGLIFYAFQSQITILLVAIFGRADSIAQVGALTRLGALFVILGGINQVLVAPRFPQIPRELLVRRILQVTCAAAALGAVLTAIAFLVPEPLLFLLGPQYDGLRLEVGWYVAGASLAFFGATLYAMNLGRRFIWWWSTALSLSLILATQIAAATVLDLGDTLDLQYFAVLTGAAASLAQIPPLVRGLRRGPRAV